jgi:triacylglycerol lipase
MGSASRPTRIYLTPGMFGFARLARFDYFGHVERALTTRLLAWGRVPIVTVCEVHPTASIRRRAATLAELVAESARGDDAPIHLVGHSTGGLDARLVASPGVRLWTKADDLSWLPRLRSVICLNTPHHGTPLATFFTTLNGQRLLWAVSAVTVLALRAGAPPLSVMSALLAAATRPDLHQLETRVIDRALDELVGLLDEAASRKLRDWMKLLRDDQGAVVQLTPEAMDLFRAGVQDRPGVRYGCVASFTPEHAARDWLHALRSPWRIGSATVFAALWKLTARVDARYPCEPSDHSTLDALTQALGYVPEPGSSDGVVPLRSQVHGELLWVGRADHLDVVGHFPSRSRNGARNDTSPQLEHHDWMASGARFDEARFGVVMDALARAIVDAEDAPPAPADQR